MSKKYFVVADVHGFYKELMNCLEGAGYDKNNSSHIFVSCGDLFDRGPDARECMRFVNSLPKDRKILIKGNHEVLMRQMICRDDYPRTHDIHNGTWNSAVDITRADYVEVMRAMRKNDEWWEYYNSCVNYAEVGNYIFVHGWVPITSTWDGPRVREDWRESDDRDWEEAGWLNGMAMWQGGARIEGKTIICGHWNTSWGHKNIHKTCKDMYKGDAIHDSFIDDGIVALDSCTVVSHKINCYVFEE